MTALNTFEPDSLSPSRYRWIRWPLALMVALAVHFYAGVWVIRATRIDNTHSDHPQVPVEVALLKPQAVTDVADAHAPHASAANPSPARSGAAPHGTAAAASNDALQASLDVAPTSSRTESQASGDVAHAKPSDASTARPSARPVHTSKATTSKATTSTTTRTTPRRNEAPDTHHTLETNDTRARQLATQAAKDAATDTADHASPARSNPAADTPVAASPAATADSASSDSDASEASNAPQASNASDVSNASQTHNAARAPAVPSDASSASTASTASTASSASGTSSPARASGVSAATAAAVPESVGPGVAAHAANAHGGEKFSLPPSSDLQYESFYNGVQNPTGTIHWSTDGSTYQMVVSIPLPFVGTYSYISEGRIDAFGLAPLRYTEQHGRRGTDVTTIDRSAADGTPHVSFTRTPAHIDLPSGAQDRFSMFMQLSSLVRGNPSRYTPGVTREFFVLDNDSGETWPIETVGDETVRTNQGFVPARHFTRLPRREGDHRKVDVWLAPSLGWLPIRFVQTEPNGTQIELRFAGSIAHASADTSHGDRSGEFPSDHSGDSSGPNGAHSAGAPQQEPDHP